MPKQNITSLNNFRHRVVLATSNTELASEDETNTDIVLVRTEVTSRFASITPVKGSFYLNGFAMQENRNAFSHYIALRYDRELDITGFGWIYEIRPSGKRWYKILAVEEMGERERYWCIQVRLQQKSVLANPPGSEERTKEESKNDGFIALPDGARL